MNVDVISSEAAMKFAAERNDIDGLYRVIQQDMHVLETIDSKPFDATPLHVAASLGHLEFATEIMTLKPSLALKLDPEGFTPILLALQHDQKKMVLRLVEINKELVRVKGRDGFTPLHLASQKGDTEILQKFIKACPDSIEDVTVRNETALHIAVEHGHYEAFEVLYQCLLRNSKEDAECALLNWKDQKGNTILHVAALYDGIEVIKLLKKNYMMNLNAKNLDDRTALDIAEGSARSTLVIDRRKELSWETYIDECFIRRFGRLRRHLTAEERNAYLVVATLIATTTYQSALSPPGC